MSHNAEKIQRWDPLVSPWIVLYAEKRKNLFGAGSLGQQVHFGDTLQFCRTFGRTNLVTSGVPIKTLTKSHDYSRLFSQEKHRLKIPQKTHIRKNVMNILDEGKLIQMKLRTSDGR